MKNVLAYILLLIVIVCFAVMLWLAYECVSLYQQLQSVQASGHEYLPFLFVPGILVIISIVAVVSYGLYKKLTINRFMTAGVVLGIFVIGVLLMVGFFVML